MKDQGTMVFVFQNIMKWKKIINQKDRFLWGHIAAVYQSPLCSLRFITIVQRSLGIGDETCQNSNRAQKTPRGSAGIPDKK